MQRLAGKLALVTGAASGIGRATAQRLAAEGASVACCDVNADGLAETLASIESAGGRGRTSMCDVADADSCRDAVKATVAAWGGLDILCNVAGIGGFHHTGEMPQALWDRMIAVNLSGPFFLSQAALPHLLEKRGAIINIASSAGLIGQAYSAAYCASKGGLVQLTKALAVEFARRGLRVNCICPGGIDTPLIGSFRPPAGADIDLVKRLKLVEEKADPAAVAAGVAYLASEEARYVNGAVLSIDAGLVVS